MIIADREVFLGNATIISGGFIFMTLTGLFNSDGSGSVFAERLVLVIIGIFSISSILFALDFKPRVARVVAIFGYAMLLVFLHNFIF